MYVTEIRQYRRSKNRVWVVLDDGERFTLSRADCGRFHLSVDDGIRPEIWEEILSTVLIPEAKEKTLALLESQDRSTGDLRKKLKESGMPEQAVEEALRYAASYHYTDDERFARNYIRYHQEGKSRRRLSMDLKKHGIPEELIQRAMDEENETDPMEQIRRLLEKKRFDLVSEDRDRQRKETARAYRFLASRGYDPSEISEGIRAYASEHSSDDF